MAFTFEKFAFWGEGRNTVASEIRQEIKIILTEAPGWLDFNRAYGNPVIAKEQEANHPVLQIIMKADLVETVMEYNNAVSDERKVSLSQRDINFLMEDNEIDMDVLFHSLKNLKKFNVKIPILWGD